MSVNRRSFVMASAAAFAIPALARGQSASPKLFADSVLVTRDRISVEVVGAGPDVVFIPGSVCSREVWRATAEQLKSRYRLHLVQIAGFGGEPARANASGPAWESTAEAIDAYVVEARLAPATLVGHSLGGTMALYAAQNHPSHYRRAMLVDATPFLAETFGLPAATVAGIRGAIAADQVQPMTMAMVEPGLASMAGALADQAMIRRDASASDPKAAGRLYVENLVLDLSPGLKAMTTPLTLVFPDNVPSGVAAGTVRANYDKAYADLATKTLIEVKDSRHFVMQDQPEAFGRALESFLAS